MYKGKLLSDDFKRIVCVYFDDRRRFVGCFVFSSKTADIVCSLQDCFLYLVKEMRRRMSADIRGGRDNRPFQLSTKGFAEGFARNSNADRSIFGNQILRQMACIGINERQRFLSLVLP